MSSAAPSDESHEVEPALRLPAIVHGEGLTLRRWMPDDAELMARMVTESLEHLLPWMPWAAYEPVALDARVAMLEQWDRDWRAGGDAPMLAVAGGVPVGSSGFHRRRGPGVLEIGYWVHVAHVGRGYATAVSRALTDAAFGIPGIERVEIHHDRANVRSGAVPRRLGFVFEGEYERESAAPAETGVGWGWAITKEQWDASTKG